MLGNVGYVLDEHVSFGELKFKSSFSQPNVFASVLVIVLPIRQQGHVTIVQRTVLQEGHVDKEHGSLKSGLAVEQWVRLEVHRTEGRFDRLDPHLERVAALGSVKFTNNLSLNELIQCPCGGVAKEADLLVGLGIGTFEEPCLVLIPLGLSH